MKLPTKKFNGKKYTPVMVKYKDRFTRPALLTKTKVQQLKRSKKNMGKLFGYKYSFRTEKKGSKKILWVRSEKK